MSSPQPVQITVTGAAGQIGYALLFRIASGQLLGPDQPIVLRMLEIEPAMKALEGVARELDDCAFPLLHDMGLTSNTCTTNCYIARSNAPEIPAERWFAMTRLDENRAKIQLAKKAKVPVSVVSNMAIWGNHSATQYPDARNARIAGAGVFDVISDHGWLKKDFIKTVQTRGAK